MCAYLTTDRADRFFLFCEAENIRLSKKCRLLLSVFSRVDGFIDAESLWLLIKSESGQIGRATVYKTLLWLHSRGYVVRKKEGKADQSVFKLALPACVI
jgi:Fe2+ or Zn2+ uptake regulation protein